MSNTFICRHKISGFIVLVVLVVVLAVGVVLVRSNYGNNNDTLRLVVVLHRHGFRELNKGEVYKNDPYGNESFWPLGYGQLRLEGKRQLFNVGKNLRALYDSFIPKFTVQSVYVETSDMDRCHMSVGSLLAGLFPPTDDQIFNSELQWQPIPIHSLPEKLDNKLAQGAPCPKFDVDFKKVTAEFKNNLTDQEKTLFQQIEKDIGQEIADIGTLYRLYSALRVEEFNKFALPEWTKNVYPDPLSKYALVAYTHLAYTTEMKRLSGGPFVADLVSKFTKKSSGQLPDNKLYIYSAHDTTLATVWHTLGLPGLINPDFGAALIFELHSIGDSPFVKFSYLNNSQVTQPMELQLQDCIPPCPLEYVVNVTQNVIPLNWTEECQL